MHDAALRLELQKIVEHHFGHNQGGDGVHCNHICDFDGIESVDEVLVEYGSVVDEGMDGHFIQCEQVTQSFFYLVGFTEVTTVPCQLLRIGIQKLFEFGCHGAADAHYALPVGYEMACHCETEAFRYARDEDIHGRVLNLMYVFSKVALSVTDAVLANRKAFHVGNKMASSPNSSSRGAKKYQ